MTPFYRRGSRDQGEDTAEWVIHGANHGSSLRRDSWSSALAMETQWTDHTSPGQPHVYCCLLSVTFGSSFVNEGENITVKPAPSPPLQALHTRALCEREHIILDSDGWRGLYLRASSCSLIPQPWGFFQVIGEYVVPSLEHTLAL